jgi:hypothetical protein
MNAQGMPILALWAQQKRSVSQKYFESCKDVRHALHIGYIFCCKNSDSPPMNKVAAMAKRYWALLLISGCPTVDPSRRYDPEIEERIQDKILKQIWSRKWSRDLRAIGLTNLPRGNPGPKRAAARPNFKGSVKVNISVTPAMASVIGSRAHEKQITMAAYLRGLILCDVLIRGQKRLKTVPN